MAGLSRRGCMPPTSSCCRLSSANRQANAAAKWPGQAAEAPHASLAPPSLPCPALPCPALPCPALPCLALQLHLGQREDHPHQRGVCGHCGPGEGRQQGGGPGKPVPGKHPGVRLHRAGARQGWVSPGGGAGLQRRQQQPPCPDAHLPASLQCLLQHTQNKATLSLPGRWCAASRMPT